MEEKILKITGEYIEQVADNGLEDVDIDYLSQIVDIHKDMKEVECMNNYGNYGNYNEYGRRGVDSKYRASKYMDGMRSGYEAYEESRNEYNNGNYGAKEDGLKELEFMMHEATKWLKAIKEKATSPEEQEIYRKHIMKISEM